jgi:hypothetical protein
VGEWFEVGKSRGKCPEKHKEHPPDISFSGAIGIK